MPKKPRSARNDFLVYLAVRSAVGLMQAVPLRIAFAFAEVLAVALHRFDRRHRNVALENLRYAFPEMTEAEREKLVRRVYRHLGLMIVEMVAFVRKLNLGNWERIIDLNIPREMVLDFLDPKKPVLMVTAHYGNWEVAGYAIGIMGFETYAIARTLDNPYLEKFLKRFRQKTGQTILAKKGDFDRIAEIMESGGKLATLGDQDAGQKGMFVNFFNRPASTHKAVALMAIRFNARLAVVGVPRVAEPMRFAVEFEDVIDAAEYAAMPDGIRKLTERFTAATERMIRRHPEQYFWLHRRWKHQPLGRSRTTVPAT